MKRRLCEPQTLPGGLHAAAVTLQASEDQLALEGAERRLSSRRRPRGASWLGVGLGAQHLGEAALQEGGVDALSRPGVDQEQGAGAVQLADVARPGSV